MEDTVEASSSMPTGIAQSESGTGSVGGRSQSGPVAECGPIENPHWHRHQYR